MQFLGEGRVRFAVRGHSSTCSLETQKACTLVGGRPRIGTEPIIQSQTDSAYASHPSDVRCKLWIEQTGISGLICRKSLTAAERRLLLWYGVFVPGGSDTKDNNRPMYWLRHDL